MDRYHHIPALAPTGTFAGLARGKTSVMADPRATGPAI
jgi:hypothetical protein